MSSPMVRSLAWCRERGITPWIVERSIPYRNVKIDLFGFGDILGIDPDFPGSLIIQTTTGDHMAERITKITEEPEVAPRARAWLLAGNRITVHGWRKVGPRGKRKLWELREQAITLENFAPSEPRK